MAQKGLDKYGKKNQIATPEQLTKAESILEPVKISLGFNYNELKQSVETLETLRKETNRLREVHKATTAKITELNREKDRLQVKVERFTFRFKCPDVNKIITVFDCQAALNVCKYGQKCQTRRTEFKRFFELGE